MEGQVEESLTSNFKVIHQRHVNYFSIFGFYDLNFVGNGTNLIKSLSHLHQKISWLTNNGENRVFWPPSCTFDVMTYVTWQRQDDVTYVKMCLLSLVTDTHEAISADWNHQKSYRGKTPGGWYLVSNLQTSTAHLCAVEVWRFETRWYPPPWASEG